MNKHFNEIETSDWLTNQDRNDFARYIFIYAKEILPYFGSFDWENNDFRQFCQRNKITPKGNKNAQKQRNHFWFNASKPTEQKINDFAHHFLRHIRNAFAHGLIELKHEGKQRSKFYLLKDFDQNGQQSMQGYIRSDLLWQMIWLLYQTRKQDERT